jgi:hypothetical protein
MQVTHTTGTYVATCATSCLLRLLFLALQEKEYEHVKEHEENKEYKLLRKLHTFPTYEHEEEKEKVGDHQQTRHLKIVWLMLR